MLGECASHKMLWAAMLIIVRGSTLLSPQLLELSGIGDRHILKKIGVPVQVDLPGAGANVQEHGGSRVQLGECPKTIS